MNFTQLQLLLQNDELHYISDSSEFFSDNPEFYHYFDYPKYEFILFENTIFDFNNTIKILNTNNIKYIIKKDSLNLDFILIE